MKNCEDLKTHSLQELEGKEYTENILQRRIKWAVMFRIRFLMAYGYATQVCILNEDGTIQKMVAAHDVGKAVNPISVKARLRAVLSWEWDMH